MYCYSKRLVTAFGLSTFFCVSFGQGSPQLRPDELTGNGRGYRSNIILRTKQDLAPFLNNRTANSVTTSLAAKVYAQLPNYEENTLAAFRTSKGRLELDIILMVHSSLTADLETKTSQFALNSQLLTQKLLETLKPGIIGFEGATAEAINPETLARDIISTNKELGKNVPLNQARLMVEQWTSHDGVLLYLKSHPGAKVTGMEEAPVYLLEITLLQSGTANPLLTDLHHLRSELGLAKTITQLRKNNLSRGAIVIGRDHEADLRQILQNLPVKAKFYQTAGSQ